MKEYKLIKEYPGSGRVGRVKQVSKHPLSNGHIELNGKLLLPTEYPQFWEEVVKKDYEILEYRSKGKILAPANNFAIEITKPGHWNINSVKRLEDGEVFTIGDFITREGYKDTKNKIRGFSVDSEDGNLIVSINDVIDRTYCGKMGCHISIVSHYKEPLLITEDGVKVYPKDRYWCVDINDKSKIYTFGVYGDRKENVRTNEFIFFSTKEAAEEYILMNKPCISLNDIFISGLNKDCVTGKSLIQLVKKRL